MRRPCHFERPVQSDRLSQSYGHTRLVSDGKVYPREMGWKIGVVVIATLIVIGANAAFGATGLSPSAEPVPGSSASPLPSLSQGEG